MFSFFQNIRMLGKCPTRPTSHTQIFAWSNDLWTNKLKGGNHSMSSETFNVHVSNTKHLLSISSNTLESCNSQHETIQSWFSHSDAQFELISSTWLPHTYNTHNSKLRATRESQAMYISLTAVEHPIYIDNNNLTRNLIVYFNWEYTTQTTKPSVQYNT